MKDFGEFEQSVGICFTDKDLLRQAFTHRSYINEHKGSKLEHNERLEFLGDAVLELIVTEFLYENRPNQNEGEMTSFRAALVNANTLSRVASALGMNKYLLLSHGEARDTGRARLSILADAFEALVGALFLDQGYPAARELVQKHVLTLTSEVEKSGLWIDAKSKFQEVAQEKYAITPSYQTIREEGPDHDKHFTVAVYVGERKVAEGKGKSKQDAEQAAAAAGLALQGW